MIDVPGTAVTPAPGEIAVRQATALALLDADMRVVWMNDALADLLEVGLRGLYRQPFAGLLPNGAATLDAALERLRGGESVVQWRQIHLTTLKQNTCSVDMTMQALDDSRWLLEIHALAPPALGPGPCPRRCGVWPMK